MTQRQFIRATVETPIGRMMMASDGEALTELCLEDWWWATDNALGPQANTPASRLDSRDSSPQDIGSDVFRLTRDWLKAYFAGDRPGFEQAPPMRPAGTPFQHEVWQLVSEIPYGMTVSYGEIATELAERRGGGRMAAQAVGGAVKRNPITIIVPCHRVVGTGRAFGGYGGRLDVKAELLEHEGVDLTLFDMPNNA